MSIITQLKINIIDVCIVFKSDFPIRSLLNYKNDRRMNNRYYFTK